jgi:hypothetical protein
MIINNVHNITKDLLKNVQENDPWQTIRFMNNKYIYSSYVKKHKKYHLANNYFNKFHIICNNLLLNSVCNFINARRNDLFRIIIIRTVFKNCIYHSRDVFTKINLI